MGNGEQITRKNFIDSLFLLFSLYSHLDITCTYRIDATAPASWLTLWEQGDAGQNNSRPQLEYASAIWDPHTAKYMYNINKVQNYAARWVYHDYSHYTSVSLIRHTKTNKFASSFGWTFTKYTSTFLQNLPSENCHPYHTLFTNTYPQNYTPHLKHKRKQPPIGLKTNQHINRHIHIQLLPPDTDWNLLPPSLCATPTVQAFKEDLARHLLPGL